MEEVKSESNLNMTAIISKSRILPVFLGGFPVTGRRTVVVGNPGILAGLGMTQGVQEGGLGNQGWAGQY